MTFFSQLRLVLWKNWVIQRRRILVSVFEIFLPLFFVVILLGMRKAIPITLFNTPTLFSKIALDGHTFHMNTTIGYAPSGKEVDQLIYILQKRYEKEIKPTETDGGTKADFSLRFQGFNSVSGMVRSAVKQYSPIVFCITFSNIKDTTAPSLPKDLRYVIRPMTHGIWQEWETSSTYAEKLLNTPSNENKYGSAGFLYLQRLVGEAVMSYWVAKTGGDPGIVNHTIWSQRMAYPPFTFDPMIAIVQNSLPPYLVFSLMISVIINTKNLVFEKEKKLKESMKLMGLRSSVHFWSWFITFSIYLIAILGFYAVFLCTSFSEETGAVLQNSDSLLVYMFLLSYGLSTIAFSFMVSAMVQKTNMGTAISGILFFGTFAPQRFLLNSYFTMSKGRKLFFSLFANCAMVFGANVIGRYEGTGEGVQWNNLFKPPTVDDNISLADCMGMFFVDSIIYLIIYWYLDNVRPGEFGVPKPLNFCFTRSYWFGTVEKDRSSMFATSATERENALRFENDPINLNAGIQINNLSKRYGNNMVVDNMSLNIYEGQISVLLGHNGAGKTTTMSMLTGFIPPSKGTAIVNGYDIATNLIDVRKSLGLCPQHNVLFDLMTVKEHLLFFASLKGATNKDALNEIDPLLTDVDLLDKKNARTMVLSGGQKRKLSVAIALIAGSKVVILDEPSTGMDPGARRHTWSVLQKHREGRTILLTTHYMDEADILGDRIAIMADGVVKCCGTSMFLKKYYGAGYHLVIVKGPSSPIQEISKLVTSHIPMARLESTVNHEMSFLLPEKETAKFSTLFTELEENKERLGITGFGTSATTMEEVFLKVGTGETTMQREAGGEHGPEIMPKIAPSGNVDGRGFQSLINAAYPSSIVEVANGRDSQMEFVTGYEKNTGLALELGKMKGIFVKKALNTWRNRIMSMVQLLLPVSFAVLSLIAHTLKPDGARAEPVLTLNLEHFGPTVIPTTAGLNPTPSGERLVKFYNHQFHSTQIIKSFDASKYDGYDSFTLEEAKSLGGVGVFNRHVIVGLEVLDVKSPDKHIHAISYYNGQPLHGQPVGVNYMLNALLQYYLDSDSYSLQSALHPLPRNVPDLINRKREANSAFGYVFAFLLSFGMAFLTTLFVHYLIKERQVGSKHLQVVSGVSPITYWIPTFLWDYISYLVPVMSVMIAFFAFNATEFIGEGRYLVILLHLLMYGWAILPCMYAMQFLFKEPSTGVVITLNLSIFSGIVLLSTINVMRIPSLNMASKADNLANVCFWLFPNYSMAQGVVDVYMNYMYLEHCKKYTCTPYARHPCCPGSCGDSCLPQNENYLGMDKPGIGFNILVFFLSGLFYFALVLFIDYHMLQKIMYRFVKLTSKPRVVNAETDQMPPEDSDVAEERKRMHASSPAELNETDPLILVDLYKKYGSLVAVDGLCLGIPMEECFGLLGQNGAGKTSAFKMLTGDIMVDGGNAYLAGYDVVNNVRKVQSNMGYCPQFDALIEQMTGRETLTMYARLKGVPKTHIDKVVNNLIHILMLDLYADKMAGDYSGGNKRKLSTAIALVGLPRFLMLDEPSAGMDPKTRRELWNVLSRIRAAGHTLIMTSHSMEECDALCTRLAIMVNGKFLCLGSPQHLKNKFGDGYTLVVQLGLNEDGTHSPSEPIIDDIKEHFPDIKVFDENQGYVHLQVLDSKSIKLADVFSKMEDTKERFNIQDYSVHQTTLEQVFLTFTYNQVAIPEESTKAGLCRCLKICSKKGKSNDS